MPDGARVRALSWQVGRKRPGRQCVGAGTCYSIIGRVLAHRAAGLFPLAVPQHGLSLRKVPRGTGSGLWLYIKSAEAEGPSGC